MLIYGLGEDLEELDSELLGLYLNQIVDGDIKAARLIYCHYQASVYAFIRLQISREDAVEELLNETFMVAFTRIATFNGGSKFRTWLCGIAKNLCSNWRRKHLVGFQSRFVNLSDEMAENLQDPEPAVLAKLEANEMKAVILECIDRLPLEQREAMYMAFYEEESMSGAADRLACPIGTLKSRLYYARAKLADCVRAAFGGVEVIHG